MTCLQATVLATALLGWQTVSAGGETVLLDFTAEWCRSCREMDPMVDRLRSRGYPVRRVDYDRERDTATGLGVELLPTFVMLIDGREVDRVEGFASYERLEQMCRLAARSSRVGQTSLQPVKHGRASAASLELPVMQSNSGPPTDSGLRKPACETSQSADHRSAGVRTTGLTLPGPDAESNRLDSHLVAATVRLRIEDADGHSCGSGTIIDARGGKALILTCGHIFRDSQGKGKVEVDLFGPTPATRLPGTLLAWDEDRDVGLLWIETPGPVEVARVAPPKYQVSPGDEVVNTGCNNGDDPSVRHNRVTSLDKFLGPPNLQVGGLPVQGRSGGGLFSREGFVIGVCNAADPQDNEGLYAALAALHAELDEAELSFVYHPQDDSQPARAPLVAVEPPPMPKKMPRPSSVVQLTESPARFDGPPARRTLNQQQQGLSGRELAALEEIRRRKAEGAEVVCIVRSRSNPQAPSEVFVFDQASPEFVEQLMGESGGSKR